jgi:hypothetical protein
LSATNVPPRTAKQSVRIDENPFYREGYLTVAGLTNFLRSSGVGFE